jgi:hypothetical protein
MIKWHSCLEMLLNLIAAKPIYEDNSPILTRSYMKSTRLLKQRSVP